MNPPRAPRKHARRDDTNASSDSSNGRALSTKFGHGTYRSKDPRNQPCIALSQAFLLTLAMSTVLRMRWVLRLSRAHKAQCRLGATVGCTIGVGAASQTKPNPRSQAGKNTRNDANSSKENNGKCFCQLRHDEPPIPSAAPPLPNTYC